MKSKYRWESIGKQMDQAYTELTGFGKLPTRPKKFMEADLAAMDRWNDESNGNYEAKNTRQGSI